MAEEFEIYEYKYKLGIGMYWCFYARSDETANEMIELFKQGTHDLKLKYKFIKKKKVYIDEPPYEFEQEQLEKLKKAAEKYGQSIK